MSVFDDLYSLNVNGHTERLKQGKVELTYLSWTWAWAEIKKRFPDASYSIREFETENHTLLPYMYDPQTGYMVMTSVTLDGITHDMWLPVMDGANKAMKSEPYTYQVKEYANGRWTGGYTEKLVEAATMFDVNKTIMRCLVKNLAMFGLGLYIYAGEDLPETSETTEPLPVKPAESLLDKVDRLKSVTTREQWSQIMGKFGSPSSWTEEQVDRWLKQMEDKNQ